MIHLTSSLVVTRLCQSGEFQSDDIPDPHTILKASDRGGSMLSACFPVPTGPVLRSRVNREQDVLSVSIPSVVPLVAIVIFQG